MPSVLLLRTSDDGILFEPTFLELIKQIDNAKILQIIQNEENPHQLSDSHGRTLLHFAAKYDNEKLSEHLINLGAEVDARDRLKQTPLMLAVDAKRHRSIRVLLKAGADRFSSDVNGRCALQRAVANDRDKFKWFASFLMCELKQKTTLESLKASEYVASESFRRDYPLIHFMQLNDVEVTRFLLEAGSSVNAKEQPTGQTALHLAVKFNCLENVKLLLEYGADVHAVDNFESTPLLCILKTPWNERVTPDIMKLLIDSSDALIDPASRKLVIKNFFLYGNRDMIRTLLQYPIDLQFQFPPQGFTPLYWLCLNHEPNVFEALRDFDFDVNLRDKDEYTLLHHAAIAGNANSVQFLLDRGADVDAENYNQETPLYSIINLHFMFHYQNREDDYMHCAEILLDYVAEFNIHKVKNAFNVININDKFIAPLFTKLALLEATGRPINSVTRSFIESDRRLKSIFDAVQLQLEVVKQIEIFDSVTLFDFIVTGNISRLAREKCFVHNLNNFLKDNSAISYYDRLIHRRSSKLNQLIELRETLVPVINEILFEFCNLSLCHVAEQIIDCLQDKEWRKIL